MALFFDVSVMQVSTSSASPAKLGGHWKTSSIPYTVYKE
jgi:hypothetical protein